MCHAAGADSSSALCFAGPVVSAELASTAETCVFALLLVPVGLAGPPADGVALVVTFTLRLSSCTLKHDALVIAANHLPYLVSS